MCVRAQGAFGNMCRGGSLFSPTKTWRRWHRRCNISQKRYAACSALAAAGVPALVMARGHKIDEVPEIPLVVSDSIEKISKTSKALELLKSVGCFADIEHVKASKKLRKGKGKMRNRRYVMRRGPLVIYASDSGITKSFRNIPGKNIPLKNTSRFTEWTNESVNQSMPSLCLCLLYNEILSCLLANRYRTLPR